MLAEGASETPEAPPCPVYSPLLGRALERDPEELGDDVGLKTLGAESFALVETVINFQE